VACRRAGTCCSGRRASRRPQDLEATAAFAVGGLLVVGSAYIHFHFWGGDNGYRAIPTIGPPYPLQSIAGLLIGTGVVAVRPLWATAVGIGFSLLTVAGYLVSGAHGLFGFKDSWLAPFAKEAFTIEVVAAAVLTLAAGPASSARFPTLAPARPRLEPRRRDPSGPGLRPFLPVGARARLRTSRSAQPGEEVVLGDRRPGRIDDPDEALRSHDGGEQLLAHLQEEDVVALAGVCGE
jgi:hypothetical protein